MSEQRERLGRLSAALLGAFGAAALMLVFWGAVRGEAILARADNPRLVEAELRLRRGRILDRAGAVLAESVGATGRLRRSYPIPNIGPAVGYYSFRYGTAGVEAALDDALRGVADNPWVAWWEQTLHRAPTGRDVRLTLDARRQQIAHALLGERAGAALLLETAVACPPPPENGAAAASGCPALIRALVSLPGYDPNQLEAQFDALAADAGAPLLNRVTQGQYQPGLLVQPLLLAWAAAEGALRLDERVTDLDRPVAINGVVTRCAERPSSDPASWADALAYRCPGPMQELGDRLGAGGLDSAFDAYGLTRAPALALATAAAEPLPLEDPLLAAIGQGRLTVTPLQIGLAYTALALGGPLPAPQIVDAVQDPAGAWQPYPASPAPPAARRPPPLPGFTSYNVLVLSGPEGSTNGWYVGTARVGESLWTAVIVLEGVDNAREAAFVGERLLTAVDNSRE
jgi:penicillin-binding protein A